VEFSGKSGDPIDVKKDDDAKLSQMHPQEKSGALSALRTEIVLARTTVELSVPVRDLVRLFA